MHNEPTVLLSAISITYIHMQTYLHFHGSSSPNAYQLVDAVYTMDIQWTYNGILFYRASNEVLTHVTVSLSLA